MLDLNSLLIRAEFHDVLNHKMSHAACGEFLRVVVEMS